MNPIIPPPICNIDGIDCIQGNSEYYLSSIIPDNLISSEYTFECIVYITENSNDTETGNRSCVFSKGTSDGVASSWHIAFGGKLTRIDIWAEGSGDISIEWNKWIHVMMTIHNGTKYSFINGKLVAVASNQTDHSNNNVYIGYETSYHSYIKPWCYLSYVKLSNISLFQSDVDLCSKYRLFENRYIYSL